MQPLKPELHRGQYYKGFDWVELQTNLMQSFQKLVYPSLSLRPRSNTSSMSVSLVSLLSLSSSSSSSTASSFTFCFALDALHTRHKI